MNIEFSDYVAIAALLISFLSFGISLYFGLKDRVQLKATSEVYNLKNPMGNPYVKVKVVNVGRRPAILTMFGGELENGESMGEYLGKENHGIRLNENEHYIVEIKFSDLQQFDPIREEDHEYTSLWFEDSLGKRYPVKDSEENIKLLKSENEIVSEASKQLFSEARKDSDQPLQSQAYSNDREDEKWTRLL